MKRHIHIPILWALLVAMLALILSPAATEARAKKKRVPFDEAQIFFELNDTDGDLGIHALIDGEAWKELEIKDPKGREMLLINVKGRLQRQGLTEIFFESAEPPFESDDPDEVTLSPEEFFRRFPEGIYKIEAETLEGDKLKSTAEITHVLPAPAGNIRVSDAEPAACDAAALPAVSVPVTIQWDPVTQSHPDIGKSDSAIEIVGYQVVVEREEPSLLVFSVDLPPDTTSVQVPPQFIALGKQFKLEILVREASGNATAVEACFATQ